MAVADFGYDAGGWRVERHPRFLADLTGDGRADIVGFADDGVWVALNNGNGTFQAPQLVVTNFGYVAGGWRVENHPRFLADLTGDGRADIVGFGDDGVWVALNNGNGTFQEPQFVVANFGYNAGGWRVENHPRFLADLTGDGCADIVGFGNAGVWVALNNGNGTFQTPQLVVENFGYNAGVWRVERHPRFLADLTGDDRADIVGFGDAGVWVWLSLNNGNRTTIRNLHVVQGVAGSPVAIDGATRLNLEGYRLQYHGANPGANHGVLVQAINSDVDDIRISDVNIVSSTGKLQAAVALGQRKPRSMARIKISDVRSAGSARHGVYMSFDTTGGTSDQTPEISGIANGSDPVWTQKNEKDDSIISVFPIISGNRGDLCTFVGETTPEGAVTAIQGCTCIRKNGDTTELFFKQTTTGNTGWVQITVP